MERDMMSRIGRGRSVGRSRVTGNLDLSATFGRNNRPRYEALKNISCISFTVALFSLQFVFVMFGVNCILLRRLISSNQNPFPQFY